ncbi:hypothetical protein BDP27DRAFT_519541 [Rhodocollybia butyracea]|uniref:Uncharacterized protein n=1 Tax=Rhodocollybia butyracea TaxID=206335 RepID=A0A9P5U8Y8_9AGAR|nr:hypothetical protein BDP27DRAFT_519541 [Rhodocollybia butyracea]
MPSYRSWADRHSDPNLAGSPPPNYSAFETQSSGRDSMPGPPPYSHTHHHVHYHHHLPDSREFREPNETEPLLSSNRQSSRSRVWTLVFISLVSAMPLFGGLASILLLSRNTPAPYWKDILPEETCNAVGAREYTATLANAPKSNKLEACQSTRLSFHGRTIRSAPLCSMLTLNGTTVVQGSWILDFDENDCFPVWSSISAEGCISYGKRTYHADLDVPPGLDALTSCRETPVIIHERSVHPTQYELVRKHNGTSDLAAKGQWIMEDASCAPRWVSVNADTQCSAYDKKRYTAILEGIPQELDPLQTCYEAPSQLFNMSQKPESCDWDEQGKIIGTWYFGVPECRPVLKHVLDNGCLESGIKVYRMC